MSADRGTMSKPNGIKTFKYIERDLVYSLQNKLFKSNNNIKVLVNSLFYSKSNLTNYWDAILY